ncbi:MAG: undecaprenyl-diphosphate phosphatase [Pseudomonadota bacterium]
MEVYQGIVLGIVQGLTEFLPVSSSGHLVLGQTLFGFTESQLIFDISVHVGTLLAVFVVYFKDILAILSSTGSFLSKIFTGQATAVIIKEDKHLKMAGMIIIGSIPTAVIGLLLKKIEHILFTSTLLVGFMLILTGTILWLSRRYYYVDENQISKYGVKEAGVIGIVQGLAVIPGISRSGSTIAAGMFMGLDRPTAARFSFLLSIPAIVGAELLGVKEMMETGAKLDAATMIATLASFITGLIALKILIQLVHSGRFHLFAPYCWFVGAVVLVSNIV